MLISQQKFSWPNLGYFPMFKVFFQTFVFSRIQPTSLACWSDESSSSSAESPLYKSKAVEICTSECMFSLRPSPLPPMDILHQDAKLIWHLDVCKCEMSSVKCFTSLLNWFSSWQYFNKEQYSNFLPSFWRCLCHNCLNTFQVFFLILHIICVSASGLTTTITYDLVWIVCYFLAMASFSVTAKHSVEGKFSSTGDVTLYTSVGNEIHILKFVGTPALPILFFNALTTLCCRAILDLVTQTSFKDWILWLCYCFLSLLPHQMFSGYNIQRLPCQLYFCLWLYTGCLQSHLEESFHSFS